MTNPNLLEALARWGMAAFDLRLVATRENHVYQVSHGDTHWALRQHRQGYRTQKQLASELIWTQELASKDINVPIPVPSQNGSLIECVDGQCFSVVTWLPGIPIGSEQALTTTTHLVRQYAQLGRTMAALHNASANWSPPDQFERPFWDRNGLVGRAPLWGRFWDASFLSREDSALFHTARATIDERLAQADLPVRLIHADLVPENVLIQKDGLAIIDFDDCVWGYWAFDVATIVNRAHRSANAEQLVNAFLNAYQEDGPDTLEHLPLLQAARALTYVGWIVPRLDEPGGRQRLVRFLDTARTMVHRIL